MDKYFITLDQLKKIAQYEPEPGRMPFYALAKEIQAQSRNQDKNKCILCEANMKKHNHTLTPMLVGALVKVLEKVSRKRINHVTKNELKDWLDHNEYGNFQKLRLFGLIAKYKRDGNTKRGEWVITTRGFKFLRGEEAVSHSVKTFRNKIVDRDSKKVTISKVVGSEPYLETLDDMISVVVEPSQTLF